MSTCVHVCRLGEAWYSRHPEVRGLGEFSVCNQSEAGKLLRLT